MDLKDLSTSTMSEKGVWLEEILDAKSIVIPGIRIKVIGKNSKHAKAYGVKLSTVMAGQQDIRSVKEANDVADDLYIGCVMDWEGFTEDGQELPCTPENVKKLFDNVPYIKRQIIEAVGDDSLFLGK